MEAITDDGARFVAHEQNFIKEAKEELMQQKANYERANIKITGIISKQLPVEPAITPEMLDNEAITKQIREGETLKQLNLQGTGMAQSLCKLLNILASSKQICKRQSR